MKKSYPTKLILLTIIISIFLGTLAPFTAVTVHADTETVDNPEETAEQPAEETQDEQASDEQAANPDNGEDAADADQDSDSEAVIDEAAVLAEYEKISEKSGLVLYANLNTGEIAVKDLKGGLTWFSNPPDRDRDKRANGFFKVSLASQILMSYTDATGVVLERGSSLHSVQRDGLSHEMRDGGIVFKYDFVKDSIMIPVMYSINDDSLSATVLTDEIDEYGGNKLLTIDLLPFFGAGGENDKGYMMVPDGSGALINMNNGKTSAADYIAPVYGEDLGSGGLQIPPSSAHLVTIVNKEPIRIPAFGMKKNDGGFLAVIASSSSRADIRASINGKGNSYNSVSSRLKYRMSGTVLLTQKEFSERKTSIPERTSAVGTPYEVRYFFLDNGDSDYVGMAEKYREYLKDTQGLETKVKEGDIPFYLDLYGYVNKIKPFLGIPVERVIPLTTLDDVSTITDKLAENGVKNIAVKLNNWVKNASFKKLPIKAKMERKVGSEKEFKNLEKELAQKGVSIYLSADLMNVYSTGYGFSKYADALKSVANTPLMLTQYVLDSAAKDPKIPSWYLLSPLKFKKFFGRYADNFSRLGTPNAALDSIGSTSFSEMSSGGISRTLIPGIVDEVLKEFTKVMPSLMLEEANAYAAPYAEHIINTPTNASYYDVIDEHIPFYQIVYHGEINLSMTAVNLSSNPEYVFLKSLETGASPLYSWVGRNSEELFSSRLDHLYSADYELWIDDAIAEYAKINSVLSKVATEHITDHTRLQKDVYMTTYGNGISVIVNYNSEPVSVAGETIEGYGYAVREAGEAS